MEHLTSRTSSTSCSMLKCDRGEVFRKIDHDELAIFSWNLLAPLYDRSGLDWKGVRLLALKEWLLRFTACDVFCFQEVDLVSSLADISEILNAYGFKAIVQEKKGFQVVNVTFFKASRLQVSWTQHRNRALIANFVLPDTSEICIANVHLEAGAAAENEKQRQAQLASVLKRAHGNIVVCGDFNSCLTAGSQLHAQLAAAELLRTPTGGITLAQRNGYVDCLDHMWTSRNLVPTKVLGSSLDFLASACDRGLPDTMNPSDHLPVGASFRLNCASPGEQECHNVLVVEPPGSVDESIRQEWLEILQLAQIGCGKRAAREQKRLEKAFLDAMSDEDAKHLRDWQRNAAIAAKAVVARAITNATPACRARNAAMAAKAVVAHAVTNATAACQAARCLPNLLVRRTHDPGIVTCENSTNGEKPYSS